MSTIKEVIKMQEFHIKSQEEMAIFAKNFANSIKDNAVIGLKGTLGAGKSFFAQNFINTLQEEKTEILSPTFNIVLSYKNKNNNDIFHFDLYRLKSAEELENIDFFDITKSGICLIEWPEIAEKFLKKSTNYIEIEIEIKDEEERIIRIKP